MSIDGDIWAASVAAPRLTRDWDDLQEFQPRESFYSEGKVVRPGYASFAFERMVSHSSAGHKPLSWCILKR